MVKVKNKVLLVTVIPVKTTQHPGDNMAYDPARELYKVNSKITKKKREFDKAFEKQDDSKMKSIGRELDDLQAKRKFYEKEVQRFQGPA
jgi:hypothetical protein